MSLRSDDENNDSNARSAAWDYLAALQPTQLLTPEESQGGSPKPRLEKDNLPVPETTRPSVGRSHASGLPQRPRPSNLRLR